MLDQEKINTIVKSVAGSKLKATRIDQVISEPMIDSEGHEALRVTIVLTPKTATPLDGDAVLDTLVQIQEQLRRAGEDRFPIIEYATKDELNASGDHQS